MILTFIFLIRVINSENKRLEYSNRNSPDWELHRSHITYLNSIPHNNFTMLSVSCREVGVDCDYVGKGETENELMDNLIEHAVKNQSAHTQIIRQKLLPLFGLNYRFVVLLLL